MACPEHNYWGDNPCRTCAREKEEARIELYGQATLAIGSIIIMILIGLFAV